MPAPDIPPAFTHLSPLCRTSDLSTLDVGFLGVMPERGTE
jgi:hypothetical protein